MREIWTELNRWTEEKKQMALATVVYTSGSSLRPEGSKMLMCRTGEIAGSVSGGCVEGAVFEEAMGVITTGVARLVPYGVSNEAAWEVGLSCGGSIRVLVESLAADPWQAVHPLVKDCLESKTRGALAVIISGAQLGKRLVRLADGREAGDLGLPLLNEKAAAFIEENFSSRDPLHLTLPSERGEVELFVEFLLPPDRLVIIGAGHISIPLVRLARELGYHTVVVDARSALATRERFPDADELIVGWPGEVLKKLRLDASTSVVCLSHDEKLDNPALRVALESRVQYVGALGSRITHNKRLAALREEGVPEDLLAQIHAPVGLNIGARLPEEIALSILAEITAEKHK